MIQICLLDQINSKVPPLSQKEWDTNPKQISKQMKQLILFVGDAMSSESISTIKSDIVAYLGNRMIEEHYFSDGVPALLLNEELSNKDRTTITQIMNGRTDRVTMFIVNKIEDDFHFMDLNIVDVKPYEKAEVIE